MGRHRRSTVLAGAAVLALACGAGAPARADAASPRFRLVQSSINAAGSPADSAGFVLGGSNGQETTVAASGSAGYVLQSGFWSYAGTVPVPIVLRLSPAADPPGGVALAWSGITPPYHIHRSANCESILDYYYYLDTSEGNGYVDAAPPEAGLTCYKVVPRPAAP